MKNYTFNDAEKLKELADSLRDSIKDGYVKKDGTFSYHVD